MGEVFLAKDTELHRKVALKFVPEDKGPDHNARKRLLREARAAAALDHPYITKIYDTGEIEGKSFIAMEHVEGQTLKQKLAQSRLRVKEGLRIASEIAEALEAAHDKGIVHLDLKPSNIMITPQGHVKVMDFGLAKRLPHADISASLEETGSALTKEGTTAGTLFYLSPEQLHAETIDSRSDVFSFGIVLFEMIAGLHPFERKSALETAAAILDAEPDWNLLPSDIPLVIPTLLRRCLQKDRSRRQRDIADARIEIDDALRHHEIGDLAAQPTSGLKPATDSSKRGRRFWISTASVAILISAAVLHWLGQRHPGKQELGIDRTRVVVAVFENRTGDPSLASLGQQIGDSVNNALRQVGEAKVAASPSGSGSVDHRRLAEVTQPGLVVSGAYYLRGGPVGLHAQIVDPWADKKLLWTFNPIRVSATDPAQAIDMSCQRVAGAVAMHLTPGGRLAVWTSRLLGAFRETVLGLAAFGINYEEAYRHFEKALSIDLDFCNPRLWMFYGLSNQARYEEAEKQLAVLESNLGRVTLCESLVIRHCRAMLEGRKLDELAVLCELVAMAPGIYNFLYLRGYGEIHVNRPRDAIKSFTMIPADWVPAAGARAWRSTQLAQAYHLAGDYEDQLKAAKEGIVQFPDDQDLYGRRATALAALGRLDEVDRVIDACLPVPAHSGTPARVLLEAAYELRAHSQELIMADTLTQTPERSVLGRILRIGKSLNRQRWAKSLQFAKSAGSIIDTNAEQLSVSSRSRIRHLNGLLCGLSARTGGVCDDILESSS